MGDAKAQHTLGKALINGELGLKADQQNGFEYLLSAVNQEFVPAYADVGYCYSQGVGTKVDYSEAFNYFTQGAALNDPCAIYNLAVCYDNGWGTAKNHNTAIEYYKKSASAGFQPAIDYLNSLSQHQKQIRQEQERRKKQELVTCPVCHGTGRVVGTGMWHGDILTCSTCFGAGMITREEFDRWRRYGF